MNLLAEIPIKFFPRDVVRGESGKVGDRFEAFFMGDHCAFEVIEHNGTFFFAKLI